ncbi:hypothetical protein [Motiliproteus sp. SC1-56]|uniref:hypothetical protein n=1 Tax=Motiliproteus sp. SC1-56 TaxID=2799565 RepID=UPI001A900FB3|nr:hypothetical protein [Motiliproteus sp. SC1-56]
MLEINDQLRLVCHPGKAGGVWRIEERLETHSGTFKGALWKPVGTLLTPEQAEHWLISTQPMPETAVARFRACNA